MSLFSTHPKLEKRILRLVPQFDFSAPLPPVRALKAPEPAPKPVEPIDYTAPSQGREPIANVSAVNDAPVLPSAWFDWAHEVQLTPTFFLAIVRDPIPDLKNLAPLKSLNLSQRFDLMNLVSPKLRKLSSEELEALYLEHQKQISDDGVITPLELSAHRLLRGKLNIAPSNFLRPPKWQDVLRTVLSYMAYHWPLGEQSKVYVRCVNRLRHVISTEALLVMPERPKPAEVLRDVTRFESAPAKLKQAFFDAVEPELADRPLLRNGLGM